MKKCILDSTLIMFKDLKRKFSGLGKNYEERKLQMNFLVMMKLWK